MTLKVASIAGALAAALIAATAIAQSTVPAAPTIAGTRVGPYTRITFQAVSGATLYKVSALDPSDGGGEAVLFSTTQTVAYATFPRCISQYFLTYVTACNEAGCSERSNTIPLNGVIIPECNNF
jgi:hypothetical protein